MWLRYGSGLLMVGMLWGCTMVNETPPPDSVPLFHADAADTMLLQAVQQDQDILLGACAQHNSCDRVHFTRAMIALFQNGDAAAASFQQAIAVAPKGPFADSSARWVKFLVNRASYPDSVEKPSGALAVMKGLVRTWLEQQRAVSLSAALRSEGTAQSPKLTVHSLQRRIRDRDKRIAELTDQLSALKRIDLETHRAAKLNLPSTLSK
jgi:hypothetical protein